MRRDCCTIQSGVNFQGSKPCLESLARLVKQIEELDLQYDILVV